MNRRRTLCGAAILLLAGATGCDVRTAEEKRAFIDARIEEAMHSAERDPRVAVQRARARDAQSRAAWHRSEAGHFMSQSRPTSIWGMGMNQGVGHAMAAHQEEQIAGDHARRAERLGRAASERKYVVAWESLSASDRALARRFAPEWAERAERAFESSR